MKKRCDLNVLMCEHTYVHSHLAGLNRRNSPIKMWHKDLNFLTVLATMLFEKYHPIKNIFTHTGSVLVRCIIISARLLVLLALCAHDTGIPSGLYHLTLEFRTSRSILFGTKTALLKTAADTQPGRAAQHAVWMHSRQVCETRSFSTGERWRNGELGDGNISPLVQ